MPRLTRHAALGMVIVGLLPALGGQAQGQQRRSSELAYVQCGLNTVGELLSQGWRIEKDDYIKNINAEGKTITLEDGTIYRADMTSGMLVGDRALLLSKYVKSEKAEGYIYTICAGGFDAWVTPLRQFINLTPLRSARTSTHLTTLSTI